MGSEAALELNAGTMSAPLDPVFFGYGGELRSGFGRQVLGRDISSPAAAFGSSTRTAFQRTYASAEADRCKVRASGGNQSQGAIYSTPVCSVTRVYIAQLGLHTTAASTHVQ